MKDQNQLKDQEKFEQEQGGSSKGSSAPQPKEKVNWVQWAIIGIIAITIALVVFL